MIRSFQREFEQFVNDIATGVISHRVIYCPITPGGGKSCLPVIVSRLLPQFADGICWAAPRVALAEQAEEAFTSPLLRRLFPHNARVRHDTNTPNPARNLQGYSTTYQAIAAAPELHAAEFARRRYILFLDEPHHVTTHFENPEHKAFIWSHALQPLVEQAALVIYASGTFERADQKPIFGVPYVQTPEGYRVSFPPEQTIRYERRTALQEKAIVPLFFIVRDSTAMWRDAEGNAVERDSFDEASYESGVMLNVTLQTEFARHLLHDTVTHWREHQQHYAQAKLLVVAPQIALAKRYTAWLRTDHGLQARIATMENVKDARDAIRAFKGRQQPEAQAIVTVGMAYEGLDVPSITHIACLTRYRSRPWLEQCFARACRTVDGKYAGYIFAPDDPLLNDVVRAIREEQAGFAQDHTPEGPPPPPGGPTPPREPEGRIIPLHSKATDTRAMDVEETLTREETARLALLMQQHNVAGISPLQLKRLMDAAASTPPPPPVSKDEEADLTPSEYEERYRKSIDDYTKSVDFAYFDGAWGSANREIRRHGFPPREGMSLDALLVLWEWLQQRWPLGPESQEEAL
jgi:superfamily II DNA or RNA helicase